MSRIDVESLMEACSRPWRKVEIGAAESVRGDPHLLSANHFYVSGEASFLVAATSIELPSGEEYFGVVVVTNQGLIERFLEGPHPPHNRPNALSLEQVVGDIASAFMKASKQVRVLRETVSFSAGVASLVPIDRGLVIEANGQELWILADDEIPMGLRIIWISDQNGL